MLKNPAEKPEAW